MKIVVTLLVDGSLEDNCVVNSVHNRVFEDPVEILEVSELNEEEWQ